MPVDLMDVFTNFVIQSLLDVLWLTQFVAMFAIPCRHIVHMAI